MPLADSACDAAMSAFPSATWKLCPDVGVVPGEGEGVAVRAPFCGCGDCRSDEGGDIGLAAREIDLRPLARGETGPSVRSSGGRSLCLMAPGEGEFDFWKADSPQSNWSRPSPTSVFSGVDGGGSQGGFGTGGSDIFAFPRERPFNEPMERSALSFLLVPLPLALAGFSTGLLGC